MHSEQVEGDGEEEINMMQDNDAMLLDAITMMPASLNRKK